MPLKEFQEWLTHNEVPQADGMEFLESLHTAGLVLYYPHRSPDWIYLKPRAVTRELLHLLDPDGIIAAALMKNKTANLKELEEQFAALTAQKQELDNIAAKKGVTVTKLFMGTMTIQAGVMARLIWWDLSWDVMEPVAYLMSFGYMTFGWAYYVLARDDIAEYGTIAGRYVHKQREKLYAKNNFSLEQYDKVQNDILAMKATLRAYGVTDKKDKEEYPIPVTQPKQTINHQQGEAQPAVE